ncbi:MAG: hypothetical protein Q7O12_16130 [Deltaproteobacteria bacterium]|nr:hypothetical protein [Deltaproteobacteria bacterium]
MIYVVFFSTAGVPATGLTPTIGVYKKVSDGTDVTPAPTISELGGGFYKFTATPAEALVVRMNGGGSLSDAEKYKVMQITPNDASLDAGVSTRAPESGGNVAAIKTKTDNLPSDPASNTQVNTRLASSGYTAPDNAGISAVKAKTDNLPAAPAIEGNVQGHVADALAAYDPPTKAELDAAVAPLALEAGLEAHVLAVLNSYDPPTRDEATADKTAILAAVAALNDLTVGEILGGDLSDSLSFPANSLADLVRKLFWVICNRLVITDLSGAFTAYKTDGVTPAAAGTVTDNGTTTARSAPTWP